MYAIVQTGSKQYRVEKNDTLQIERIEAEEGQEIELKEVLVVSSEEGVIRVGRPTVAGCVVKARVLGEVKGPKVVGVKYKRRKNNYRKFGHRQIYTDLEILEIVS